METPPIERGRVMVDATDPLIDLFQSESGSLLASMAARLEEIRAGVATEAAAARLRQDAHSLGGLAALIGMADVQACSRSLERAIDILQESGAAGSPEHIFTLFSSLRGLVSAALAKDLSASADEVADGPAASPLILVVDDSRTVLRFLDLTLRRAGFRVLTAATEAEAVELLARERFSLLLLDVSVFAPRQPESLLDGLRQSARVLPPVLLQSNRQEAELREIARRAGAAGSLPKTNDSKRILAAVEDCLPPPSRKSQR